MYAGLTPSSPSSCISLCLSLLPLLAFLVCCLCACIPACMHACMQVCMYICACRKCPPRRSQHPNAMKAGVPPSKAYISRQGMHRIFGTTRVPGQEKDEVENTHLIYYLLQRTQFIKDCRKIWKRKKDDAHIMTTNGHMCVSIMAMDDIRENESYFFQI